MDPTEASPNSNPPKARTSSEPPTTNETTHSPEEIARLLESWKISPETHDHILHTRILPTVLHPFLPAKDNDKGQDKNTPNRQPLAVLLLGQTGAGKTHLAPLLAAAFSQPYSPPAPPPPTSTSPPPPPQQQQQSQPPPPHPTPTPTTPPRPPPIHLIADTYKTHHPHFHTCLTTLRHPSQAHLASRLAGPAAAAWLEGVCDAAARAGVDVLVETACRRGGVKGKGLGRLVGGFVGQGYAVRVVVVGVGRAVSWGGVVGRFWGGIVRGMEKGGEGERGGDGGKGAEGEKDVEKEVEGQEGEQGGKGKADDKPSGYGGPMPLRLTPRIVHDESLEGVRGAVDWLDGEGASISNDNKGRVDRVVVLRRGMKVVYANERIAGGGWEKEPAALKALEREWARPLTEDERYMMEENIKMLRSVGKPEVDKEIEEIQRLIAELGATDGTIPDATPFDPVDFIHKELP